MRQITTTVGNLAAASANNICLSQTPAAGQLALNGSLAASSFVGTGSITNNVMTITAVTSGALAIGRSISAVGAAFGQTVTGLLTGTSGTGTYVVSVPQTLTSTTIYGSSVATLDVPRRILITPAGNESAKTFTIVGTNSSGMPQTEIISGTNALAFFTNLDFKTVTSISISAAAAGAITVGTTTVAASDWVRLDEWADSTVAIQCTVSGTATYTVQQTLQDPNSATNPITAYSVAWLNSSDAAAVNASTTIQTSYQYSPTFARILLTAGTGSVTATFAQNSVVPY